MTNRLNPMHHVLLLIIALAFLANQAAAQNAEEIQRVLIGIDDVPTTGLDINNDSIVDVADVIALVQPGPFNPTENTTLDLGSYLFSDVTITTGITVTALGDVTIKARVGMDVYGSIVSDGFALSLLSDGELHVMGTVDNSSKSTTDTATAGDLLIQTTGGRIMIGDENTPAALTTSGETVITDDATLEEWEFDVLTPNRSASPLAPVVAISADTIIDSVVPGFPIEVVFAAEAADPDGGPITYSWDFGDGGSSTEQNPVHAYATDGVFIVTLTVTDNDSQSADATMQIVFDDGDEKNPAQPGVWGEPDSIVVGVGDEVIFDSAAVDPQDVDDLNYSWDFGDATNSSDSATTKFYAAAGRYDVSLTVTDQDGVPNTGVATCSIYVYEPSFPKSAPTPNGPLFPHVFNANHRTTPPVANAGRAGRNVRARLRGDLILGQFSDVKVQNGGPGTDRSGTGDVQGGRGQRGGSLSILVSGSIDIHGGATLANGDGGRGGNATATAPFPQMAWAKAGSGGEAGRRLRIVAGGGISFSDPFGRGSVTIKPGDGGPGGIALATGNAGMDKCPTGDDGASAKAKGGNGGKAGKFGRFQGAIGGLGLLMIDGGLGGLGGNSTATGGRGGHALGCAALAQGGRGGWAEARAGRGGRAPFGSNVGGFVLSPDAFSAGAGGVAIANGGEGGDAQANAPACTDAGATGGIAFNGAFGNARAYGGKGGAGRIDGNGGNATANAGDGGSATAVGGDCTDCGDAGDAAANGKDGGNAKAIKGKKGGGGGNDGTATANAGDGGSTAATGGTTTGQCDVCPAGKGGDGGDAAANSGNGGQAVGDGTLNGGDGGDSAATGGNAAKGATCCTPPMQGGAGGKGGDANSVAGTKGTPNGNDGNNTGGGGNGGNGGDGEPAGGAGGKGVGSGSPNVIPDGAPGLPGMGCPTSALHWKIDFITDNIIPPNTEFPEDTTIALNVYEGDKTNLRGMVDLRSLPASELGGGETHYFFFPPAIGANPGGIEIDLVPLLLTGEFEFGTVDVDISNNCIDPITFDPVLDCITLIGLANGEVAGQVQSTQAGPQTLHLPPPNNGARGYQSCQILGGGQFDIPDGGITLHATERPSGTELFTVIDDQTNLCVPGGTFVVNIDCNNTIANGGNGVPIGDYNLNISFDPQAVQVIGFRKGLDGFGSGPQLTVSPGNINAVPFDPSQGPGSTLVNGTLFGIEFQNMNPLKNGPHAVVVEEGGFLPDTDGIDLLYFGTSDRTVGLCWPPSTTR